MKIGGSDFAQVVSPLEIRLQSFRLEKLEPIGEIFSSSSSLLLSSLELSETKVCEPYIRARLGTAAHVCEVVVLKLRTLPIVISEVPLQTKYGPAVFSCGVTDYGVKICRRRYVSTDGLPYGPTGDSRVCEGGVPREHD